MSTISCFGLKVYLAVFMDKQGIAANDEMHYLRDPDQPPMANIFYPWLVLYRMICPTLGRRNYSSTKDEFFIIGSRFVLLMRTVVDIA